MISTLVLYSIITGTLALFVTWSISPTRRPNTSSVYWRFYALSLSVYTVTLALGSFC